MVVTGWTVKWLDNYASGNNGILNCNNTVLMRT